MKYILLIHYEEALFEDERLHLLQESVQLANQLHQRQYLDAAPLQSASATTGVKIRDGKRLVTDGPFAETRELQLTVERKNMTYAYQKLRPACKSLKLGVSAVNLARP